MGAVSPRLVGGATLSAIQMAKSAMANATARTITTSTRCRMSKPGMDREQPNTHRERVRVKVV